MITRLVQMTFREECCEQFLQLFNNYKQQIRHFPGCRHLELWNDIDNPNIYFTYSVWNSPNDLDEYRHSELYETIWSQTKLLFAAKAQAHSTQKKYLIP